MIKEIKIYIFGQKNIEIFDFNEYMNVNQNLQQNGDMKSELRNFINLLQTGNQSAYKSIKSSGKLSVILSASEPQSSSIDKQNSNQSANRSIKHSQFQTVQKTQIYTTIKQLLKTGLSKTQQKLLADINWYIDDIIKKKQNFQHKCTVLEQQLGRQKKGTDQLLQALMKMDEQQKQLWNTYYQLSDKFNLKQAQLKQKVQEINKFQQQVDSYKKQLKFMKKLVYVANQNYEQLENKYQKLYYKIHISSRSVLKQKPVLVLRQKRSEKNLLTERSASGLSKHSNKQIYSPLEQRDKHKGLSPDRYEISSSCSPMRKSDISVKSRKSISPLIKDKENIQCNFKDVYRKMLLKNLKSKKSIKYQEKSPN